MEIKTKFNINDLVQYKYQKGTDSEKHVFAFEVIEILTNTCMGGTQFFYVVRSIFAIFTTDYVEGKKNKTIIDITSGGGRGEFEYTKFREDELKECPIEIQNQIKGV